MTSPTVKLNSGNEMPLVGFGLWKVNNDTCADTVYNAIKAGYRLFDGACGGYFPDVVTHLTIGSNASFAQTMATRLRPVRVSPVP